MKVFLTGVNGQLGHDVVNALIARGHEAVGSDLAERYAGQEDGSAVVSAPYISLDITDRERVSMTIKQVNPEAVIHCAAWTAVDAAEEEENHKKVQAVNVTGTKNLAEICKELDIKMLYMSTDYVFDGQGEMPWKEDCQDYAPLNIYGKTKLEGELSIRETLEKYFIVRIAWVFGKNGNNFIKTMLKLGKTHDLLSVVCDQIGTPTYTFDLARLLVDMIETEKYGIYHATNEGGYISWFEFTKEIFHQALLLGHEEYGEDKVAVKPVTTAEYGVSKAKRPFNSRLSKEKLRKEGFLPLPDWKDALKRYLQEIEF